MIVHLGHDLAAFKRRHKICLLLCILVHVSRADFFLWWFDKREWCLACDV